MAKRQGAFRRLVAFMHPQTALKAPGCWKNAMELFTESDLVGLEPEHPWAHEFEVLRFADGSVSCLPNHLFHDPLDEGAPVGELHIGRCSSLGSGSLIKFASETQKLNIGRFVTGGMRLRFLLNGRYESRTLSTYLFAVQNVGVRNVSAPAADDCLIKNDVWIGDEVTILPGSLIENGCIIEPGSLLPRGFRSEPYGIYAGNPARLVGFRFPASIRTALLELAWWDKPMAWIKAHNDVFLLDLTVDEKATLERLKSLQPASVSAK